MKYGNIKKIERPLQFLLQNPGWHNVTDIAFACGITRHEVSAGLLGKPVLKENVYLRFPVACSGIFCMKMYEVCYKAAV